MSIAINSNFERDQYQATFTGQTVFQYSFPIFADTYLAVFQYPFGTTPDDRIQKLTLGVDYTVTGVGEAAGGTIVLTVGAVLNDIITVMGIEPIERQSVFQDLNPFTVALNQQLNEQTVMAQQSYTYWHEFTPRYNADELVSHDVRPQKLILPMLPDMHVWVGRGALNTNPDDIVTMPYISSGGGDVNADHPGMRPSIAQWTGTDFVLTDSDLFITGAIIGRTATLATEDRTGWDDIWGAMHWPAHATADRPISPADGDTYYDTDTNQFFGYLSGVWTPFSTGSSGGASIVETITQANAFAKGDFVRLDVGSGLWDYAKADTDVNAELFGMVIDASGTEFTIQQIGMVDALAKYAPMVPGTVYFLDPFINGNMTDVEPSANGQVSLPVFKAKGVDYGELLNMRGLVIGTGLPINPATPVIIKTIHQVAHTLVVGDYVRLDSGGLYVRAQADTLADAQGLGFVIQVIDADDFVLQVDGYIGVGVFTGLVPGTIYYLDPDVAGTISSPPTTIVSNITKPVFAAESATTGWILPQRPLPNSSLSTVTIPVNQTAHGFVAGNVVKSTTTPNTYALALADTMLNAYRTAGMVVYVVDADNFILQQSGFVQFDGSQPPVDPITAGNNYFLSPVTPGEYSVAEPSSPFASRPVILATSTMSGWILPQRPILKSQTDNIPVIPVNQVAHGFVAGNVLKVTGVANVYAKALANTMLNAYLTAGVVVFVIDADNFLLQQSGFVTFDPGQPPTPSLTAGNNYFLSPTVAGSYSVAEPSTPFASRPVLLATDTLTAWVLPQRPIQKTSSSSGPITPVTQVAHGFVAGQWVKNVSTGGSPITYALAQATNLVNSYLTVGMVIFVVDANNFLLQQSGYVVFDPTQLPTTPALTVGQNYFLSPTTPGAQQIAEPITPLPSRPTFQCTRAVVATSAEGWILPQKPTIASAGGSGSTVLITTVTPAFGTINVDLPGLFAGQYTDFIIIGRNLQFKSAPIAVYGPDYGQYLAMELYIAGVLNGGVVGNQDYGLTAANTSGTTLTQYFPIPGSTGNSFFYGCLAGGSLQFQINMYGIRSTTTSKQGTLESQSASGTGFSTQFWEYLWGIGYPSGNPLPVSPATLGAITGVKLGLKTGSTFAGIGTISVYGVLS